MRAFISTTLFLAAALLSSNSAALSFNVEMDQAMLQQALSSAFPVQRDENFVSVQLAKPQVILAKGSDRIGIKSVATVSLPGGNRFAGTVIVDGKPRYSSKDNALYLDQARVRDLNAPGVPEVMRQEVLRIANVLVRSFFDRQPLYVFNKDEASSLVGKQISRVVIKNGKLVVEMSAF